MRIIKSFQFAFFIIGNQKAQNEHKANQLIQYIQFQIFFCLMRNRKEKNKRNAGKYNPMRKTTCNAGGFLLGYICLFMAIWTSFGHQIFISFFFLYLYYLLWWIEGAGCYWVCYYLFLWPREGALWRWIMDGSSFCILPPAFAVIPLILSPIVSLIHIITPFSDL